MTTDVESWLERKYLSAIDLEEGRDVVVSIESVERRDVENPKSGTSERKPVVTLTEPLQPDGPRQFILNKTNIRAIKAVVGNGDPKAWQGKSITLYRTAVPFGAEMKDAIRVRPTLPKPAPAGEHVLTDEDEIPF